VVSTVNMTPGALPVGSGGGSSKGSTAPAWQTLQVQITATIFESVVPTASGAVAPAVAPKPAVTGTAPAAPAGSTAVPNS
jgi:hypothetical protein